MQGKNVFHLFIPSLLQQLKSWQHDFSFEVDAPHLSELLTQYSHNKSVGSQSLDEAFFRTIDSKVAELPIAYYRYQAQANEVNNHLICADPIHLEAGMNDVTLTNKITDLSESEADELIQILNKHFSQDGLQFIYGSNQHWYLSYDASDNKEEAIHTHVLDSVLMQNIVGKTATSINPSKFNWQVIQNETQMLLHTSEVNQQREIAGLKTVNSLWFWGAGKPIHSSNISNFDVETIYSTTEFSSRNRGELFAKATESQWRCLPEDLSQLIAQVSTRLSSQKAHESDSKPTTQVLILEQLFMPNLENNLEDFQRELTQIDNELFKPLLKAWKDNRIDVVVDCCDGNVLKPHPPAFWKFWLQPKKLHELAT